MNPLSSVGEWLLSEAMQALAALPGPPDGDGRGAPSRAYVSFDRAAWDDCCEGGGQLVVSIDNVYPSDQFPAPSTSLQRCRGTWAIDATIELVRCNPGMDSEGPSAAAVLSEANRLLLDEAWAIGARVSCAFDDEPTVDDAGYPNKYDGVVRSIASAGEDGDCMGATVAVTIHLDRFPDVFGD